MTSQMKWRIDRWPPLAWLETVIKLVGMLFGFSALRAAFSENVWRFPEGAALFQWVVLLLLSLGLLAAIGDRLREREGIAMGFVILNNIAHWGFVLALLAGTAAGLQAFAALFLLGDIVKVLFIRLHRFNVRDIGQPVLYALTGVYIFGYFLLIASNWF